MMIRYCKQTFDGVTTYPYGTNAYKVCESEMMELKKKVYLNNIDKFCNDKSR